MEYEVSVCVFAKKCSWRDGSQKYYNTTSLTLFDFCELSTLLQILPLLAHIVSKDFSFLIWGVAPGKKLRNPLVNYWGRESFLFIWCINLILGIFLIDVLVMYLKSFVVVNPNKASNRQRNTMHINKIIFTKVVNQIGINYKP